MAVSAKKAFCAALRNLRVSPGAYSPTLPSNSIGHQIRQNPTKSEMRCLSFSHMARTDRSEVTSKPNRTANALNSSFPRRSLGDCRNRPAVQVGLLNVSKVDHISSENHIVLEVNCMSAPAAAIKSCPSIFICTHFSKIYLSFATVSFCVIDQDSFNCLRQ